MHQSFGHKIRLIDIDGKVWEGRVSDFSKAIDNDQDDEPPYNAIIVETFEHGIEFHEDEIQSIEILD
jgi:hypothetical protein